MLPGQARGAFSEDRNLLVDVCPDEVRVGAVVVVCEQDPQPGDGAPVHAWVRLSTGVGDVGRGFADDLEQAFGGTQQHLLGDGAVVLLSP